MKAEDFAQIVLPGTVHLELPRVLGRKVLEMGKALLVFDNSAGSFVRGPKAKAIALALHDANDPEAEAWLVELVAEYNDYVSGAQGSGGATTYFIP